MDSGFYGNVEGACEIRYLLNPSML